MSTYIRLTASKSTAIFKARPSVNDHASDVSVLAAGDALLVGFPALDAAYRKRRIEYVALDYSTEPEETNDNVEFGKAELYSNAANFTQSTVTFSNAPDKLYPSGRSSAFMGGYFSKTWRTPEQARTVLLYGARIEALRDFSVITSRGARPPYIGVSLSDEDIGLTPYGSPASGYIPKNAANTFSWQNAGEYDAYTAQSQTAAVFHYRVGTSGAWQTRSLTTGTSTTLATGTLTGDVMQWYVSVTSSSDVTTDSPVYTLSTTEALPTATPIAPVGTIVDGTAPTEFSWSHEISTGSEQTAADLETSADGVSWSQLASVTGSAQTYTVPAGTLPAGTLYWRVRTYNQDASPGDWSESAQIVVVAPPFVPAVTVVSSPRPTVTWTAQGQEGYQVILGGYDSGQIYGTAKSWTPPDYLPDGQYTARVRVVNVYGLWSDFGGTVFTVSNTAGAAIALTAAQEDGNAAMTWTASGYDGFYIYRDGEKIAETADLAFTDRYAAAGTHSYQIRGVYSGSGNYGLSDVVPLTITLDAIILTDPETGAQLAVRHCLASNLEIQRQRSRAVTYQHYRGAALPSAEIAPDEDETYSFAPVFLAAERENMLAFEAVLGRVMHLRDIHGTALFGVIDAMSMAVMPQRTSYAVTVTAVAYEEVQP